MVKAKKRRSGCAASVIIAVLVVASLYFLLPAIRGDRDRSSSVSQTTAALPDAGGKTPAVTESEGEIASPAGGWYDLLSGEERSFYSKVYGAVSAGLEKVTAPFNYFDGDRDMMRKCARFCLYDHPEFIKYDGSLEFSYTYDGDTGDGEVELALGTNSYGDAEQRRFDEQLNALAAGAEKLPTEFDRVLFVHDEIVKNTEYDKGSLSSKDSGAYVDAHSAYGCLVNGGAVCEGYSKAFLAAMRKIGVDCLYVAGSGKGEDHAWNCVKVDGDWYLIDVTWDDPVSEKKNAGAVRRDYFCLTSDEMSRDHSPDREFSELLPDCSATACNYHVRCGLVLDPYTREGAEKLFDSGAKSVKFLSQYELDRAVKDLFTDGGCYEIDAFDGKKFSYSDENMIINVYFSE